MPAPTDDARVLRGLRLVGGRAWFDAHEALEEVWRETGPGAWRDCLQGLIQVCVALEHLRRDNLLGTFNVWTRARARLAGQPEWVHGIGVVAWLTALDEFLRVEVQLAERVRAQLTGGVPADDAPAPELGGLPPLEGWPIPPLTPELEARVTSGQA